jgi:hypothetical protein
MGQVTFPMHRDDRTTSTSPTESVGTCVSTTRCTTGALGFPVSPVTVMRTVWYALVPALSAKVVGSVISVGIT